MICDKNLLPVLIFVLTFYAKNGSLFELSVIHVNDFHARFDQISSASGVCKDASRCIGGFSRLYAQIKSALNEKPDSILLNAGDNFQGTLYYNIGKWNITQEFLNKIPWDAMVLGNHEFEDKIEGLLPFVEAIKFPIVVSNIDASKELSLNGTFTKSIVVEKNGKKIGIIGVIYSKTNELQNTGRLKFLPESPSVNEEAERLVKEEGVFTNIVLSHSGYDVEQAIASNASEKIGLIVGAHSHTFLWSGDNPPGPDLPAGPYPTLVTSKHNKTVLVVQASCFSKYLGNITVYYNDDGEVEDFSGAPIFLSNDKLTDSGINSELEPWRKMVDAVGFQVLGSTMVTLEQTTCYYKECTLGNFLADAMVFAFTTEGNNESWTYASIALHNTYGVRTEFSIGNITYNDLSIAQAYGDTMNVGEIQGRYLKEAFEYSVKNYQNDNDLLNLRLLQVSGLQIQIDLTQPVGKRVRSIKVRCQMCLIPSYEEFNLVKTYRVIIPKYLSKGGDDFIVFKQHFKIIREGPVDINVTMKYLKYRSPIFQEESNRIAVIRLEKRLCITAAGGKQKTSYDQFTDNFVTRPIFFK